MHRKNSCIAIVSGKGGSGKTLISISMTAWLAYIGFNVLLIDMDMYTSGATYFLDINITKPSDFNLGEYFSSNDVCEITATKLFAKVSAESTLDAKDVGKSEFSLIRSINTNFDPNRVDEIDKSITDVKIIVDKLRHVINRATTAEPFDYILIDTRGGCDTISTAAALVAGACIVITETDSPSFKAGTQLMKAISSSASDTGNQCAKLGFIMNKNIHRIYKDTEALEKHLRSNELKTSHLATIDLDRNIVESFQQGIIPLTSKSYFNITYPILNMIRRIIWDESEWSKNQSELQNKYLNLSEMQNNKKPMKLKKDMSLVTGIFTTLLVLVLMFHIVDAYFGFMWALFEIRIPLFITLPIILLFSLLLIIWVSTKYFREKYSDE